MMERMEKKCEKYAGNIAIILLLLAGGILPIFFSGQIRATHEYIIGDSYGFQELSMVDVVQEFTPEYHYLYSIELLPILIYSETDGNICIWIENPEGKNICEKEFKASEIAAGDFVSFPLGAWLKPGKVHKLHITYDGTAVEKPQVMTSEKNKNLYETGNMYVGDVLMETNMAVTYHYR